MREWTSFDAASHRALIISAYRSNKISGARAWEEFAVKDLWGDKEEAFFHYINGLAAFEAARDVMGAPAYVRRGVKRIILFLYGRNLIRMDTAQWVFTLFGVESE